MFFKRKFLRFFHQWKQLSLSFLSNEEANKLLAQGLYELGNLLFIALSVSQFLGEKYNLYALITGVFLSMVCYTISYYITQRRKE